MFPVIPVPLNVPPTTIGVNVTFEFDVQYEGVKPLKVGSGGVGVAIVTDAAAVVQALTSLTTIE